MSPSGPGSSPCCKHAYFQPSPWPGRQSLSASQPAWYPLSLNQAPRCSALPTPTPTPPLVQFPHKGFQNEGTGGVAVLLPPGKYVVTRMIEIYQSNVVLRGSGVSGG